MSSPTDDSPVALSEDTREELRAAHAERCPRSRMALTVEADNSYRFACVGCGWQTEVFAACGGALIEVARAEAPTRDFE